MKRIYVLFAIVMFVFGSLSSVAFALAQPTPTNLPETNPPATATPQKFCQVTHNVYVRNTVVIGVRVRLLPSTDSKILRVAKPSDNPQRAIGMVTGPDGKKWWRLCSITGEYMSADPDLTIGVAVTPQPPTPTRFVMNTPLPTATATATENPVYVWIVVDVDGDGVEHVLRCKLPCKVRIVGKDE